MYTLNESSLMIDVQKCSLIFAKFTQTALQAKTVLLTSIHNHKQEKASLQGFSSTKGAWWLKTGNSMIEAESRSFSDLAEVTMHLEGHYLDYILYLT